jgi:hypothetical protein
VVGAARASTTVARGVQRPALKIDARGYAEVSWTEAGARRFLVVPPRGKLLPGGRLDGRDVSRNARATVRLPFVRAVRRTADGRFWALQAWAKTPKNPVELRFSRWRGAPTVVELEARCCESEARLEGRATFHGRPVFGYSRTPEGRRLRLFAYVDCFGCPVAPAAWSRLIGVALRAPDGRFSLQLRPAWQGVRYRATVEGPNIGTTYAPDASTVVTVTPA